MKVIWRTFCGLFLICILIRAFLKSAQFCLYPGASVFGTGKVKKMNNIKLAENTLGQRIKAQRIRMGYTQEQLAEIMCVPKTTLSAYENDKVDIKSSVITELSGILDTDPNYLLGAEQDSYIIEMTELLKNLDNEVVREMLMKQVKALI